MEGVGGGWWCCGGMVVCNSVSLLCVGLSMVWNGRKEGVCIECPAHVCP